ncbi:MAG: hypothetical protein P9L94_13795 [Candidatus Hinthialibacter antarcticus]|nr:hypothetical protein [Candidatus Hinthialibacter antarcticus]
MQFIFSILFFLCMMHTVFASTPQPFAGFEIKPLDISVDLVTGLYNSPEGIVACDRGQGALLLFPPNRPAQILFNNLNTPVDVSKLGNEWLVLQEESGSLIVVDASTSNQRIIASGFQHPSAFALDENGRAYVVEFDTGFLFRIELDTGEIEQVDVFFDKPSDVVFVPPNRLIVADQISLDGRGGSVYTVNTQGQIIDVDRRVTDPTSLAISDSGELYATSFFIREHQMGHSNQNNKGGVIRFGSFGRPEVVADNLIGPTSLLFEKDGSLVVLEEPTDSLYRYSPTGQRTVITEGFSRIQQAVRNTNGAIVTIEGGLFERLRTSHGGVSHQTWAEPEFGNWERAALASDGIGNVYLSEPFLSHIHVFDSSGNQTETFSGIVPFYMAGIPSGGVYAFTQSGNATFMTRLGTVANPITIRLDLNSVFTACVVRQDNNLLMALSSGELSVLSPEGNKISTLLADQPGFHFSSIVTDSSSDNTVWLLEGNQKEIYYLNRNNLLQPVAQLTENGVLLTDPEGVLFLSESGKRFIIKPEQTKIHNWTIH